jgi:hypothetical protein
LDPDKAQPFAIVGAENGGSLKVKMAELPKDGSLVSSAFLFYEIKRADCMITRHKFFTIIIILLFISNVVTGCSTKPTNKQAKYDLQKWFETRWPNTLSIIEYEKTKEEGDDKKHTIYYQAKVQFIKDTAGCERTCCGEICFDRLINEFRWVSKKSNDPNIIRKGDLFEMHGRDTFSKTEKGWITETF